MKKCMLSFLVIFMFSCTEQKISIPFTNVPHTQYLKLRGTVPEIQIKAYNCNITDSGYGKPRTTDLKSCLYPQCNPCFDFMFQDLVFSYKDDIDIYYQPIESIKNMFGSIFDITDLSYTFNKNGFITNISSYYMDNKIGNMQIKYNEDNMVNNINYNLPSINFSKKGVQYNKGTIVNNDYIYNSDSIRKIQQNISPDKDTSIFVDTYKYINKDDFIKGLFISELKTDSFHIFINNNKVNKVICYIDSFSYKRGDNLSHIDRSEQTVFIANDKVYSIFPKNDNLLDNLHRIENSQSNIIKYNDFIFYYNKTDDRITNITNSHTSIQYTISYINDKRGNWIKMTITTSRETYERILYLKKELINIKQEYQSWSSADGEFKLYKILDRFIEVKKELDNNYKSDVIENIEKISNKIIIERNIFYYD